MPVLHYQSVTTPYREKQSPDIPDVACGKNLWSDYAVQPGASQLRNRESGYGKSGVGRPAAMA
ncbi:MAG TPA: hypothetical protein VJP83_16665 [Terriglobales bacterium]|nr:hypothetical protein [Terriglobales bacterium]